jgi:uncharacterized protein YkwD
MRALVLVAVLLMIATPVMASPRREALRIINEAREAKGCDDLTPANHELLASARQWSRHMARIGGLAHSIPRLEHWAMVGEVVGMGPTWRQIIDLLFGSSEHRRILLDCDYDVAALGFIFRDGVWLTGRFYAR